MNIPECGSESDIESFIISGDGGGVFLGCGRKSEMAQNGIKSSCVSHFK